MEKGRILVLDDDPVVNLSCRRILGAEGYHISTVERGEDALKRLEKESFDLLITDIRLPDINGMIVLKEARIAHPEVDVVVITAYPTVDDAKESIRLGAFEYIEKPFTPDFILNVAKKVFDKRGWILRKDFIDQFRNYIVSLRDTENPVIYYKEGTWARPLKEGLWEVGCDMRYWLLSGQLLFVDFPEGLTTIVAGEPFARVLSSTGEPHELISPMTGVVKEINSQANTVMTSLVPEHLGEGWLLWLVRVEEVK